MAAASSLFHVTPVFSCIDKSTTVFLFCVVFFSLFFSLLLTFEAPLSMYSPALSCSASVSKLYSCVALYLRLHI